MQRTSLQLDCTPSILQIKSGHNNAFLHSIATLMLNQHCWLMLLVADWFQFMLIDAQKGKPSFLLSEQTSRVSPFIISCGRSSLCYGVSLWDNHVCSFFSLTSSATVTISIFALRNTKCNFSPSLDPWVRIISWTVEACGLRLGANFGK